MKNVIIVILVFTFQFLANPVITHQHIWTYDGDFLMLDTPSGIVITPDDKIWIGTFHPTDSIFVNGVWEPVTSIRIYNPDGSLHHLIKTLPYNDMTDTLWNSCRGMSLDNNGNVLYSNWNTMWRINYQTYEGMNKLNPFAGNSITEMACDANGYIYVHRVIPGGEPITIFDSNFNLYTQLDSSWTISRSLVVSDDGNDIYLGRIYAGTFNNGIIHYRSDTGNGPDGTYTTIDTIWKNIWAGQSMDWDQDSLLWVGSYWDIDQYEWGGWYAIDVSQDWVIVDTLRHFVGPRAIWDPVAGLPTFLSPRGAAWSNDNEYMYTCDFDGNIIKRWRNLLSALSDDKANKTFSNADFILKENYPNPFNPKTRISFEILHSCQVKLEIVDMLGRRIKTILNKKLQPNYYEIDFDGTNLPSGTYFHRITTPQYSKTGKMQLIR